MKLASNSDRSSTLWISLVWYQYSQRICLKNYYTEMCNPVAHVGREQSESGFCDPSPPGLFRQMMEGCSLWSTPRPTSHSPHVLRPPWQHAWVWHFSWGYFVARDPTHAHSLQPVTQHCGWLKITLRHAWIDVVDILHYLSQDNHIALGHRRMQHVAINPKSNKHNAYCTCSKWVLCVQRTLKSPASTSKKGRGEMCQICVK